MTGAPISALARAGSLAALFLATAGPAAATAVYGIDVTVIGPTGVLTNINGTNGAPISEGQTFMTGIPGAAIDLTYGVKAKPGQLASLSNISALAPGARIGGSVFAVTSFALDDLSIMVPGLPDGTPIKYSINFDISGHEVATESGLSQADAEVTLYYGATGPTSVLQIGDAFASTQPGASYANGVFSHGLTIFNAQTPLAPGFVGETNGFEEFMLKTTADVGAVSSSQEQGQASATSDFADPFSFPTDGPVFNVFDANGDLLAGAIVDSSEGCIVNNRFLCGGGTASVPEPSTWTMMILGLAGLGCMARWRRHGPPGLQPQA
jgi:hypothetical protein